MTKDMNKGISAIRYNALGLPEEIEIKSPVAEAKNEYIYDATGKKLQVRQLWNPLYSQNPIGSNRYVIYNTSSNARIVQMNHFYPFGMGFSENTSQNEQTFKYNGKELDMMHGLNQYDYNARHYDPVVGRFTTMDPLAEKYYDVSPYVYCNNNPVNAIDPDGRFPVWAIVGAAVDYGFQVYDNYQKGNTGYDAWVGNVDFVDVALSAVNPVGKFKVAKTLVVEGTKAAINISANNGVEIETDVAKVATDAVVNTAVSVGTGKITDAGSTKSVQNANKEVSAANKQLKTAERQAERSPNSTKKAEAVNTAQSNAQAARNKQVGTQMLNSTVGQAPNATQQAATTTTERIRKEDEKR